jgi:transposase
VTCQERLQRVIPPTNTRPVRVFSQDESRFGLLTVRRRRLTACGVQPVGPVQHVFEWFYVYGAVAPTTGERFFLELPYLNADMFQIFLEAFAHAFPDSLNILLLDHSGAHTAQRLRWPGNVGCVWLPPYCPELNPIERVWRDLKDDVAWEQFTDLAAQLDAVGHWLQLALERAPWWRNLLTVGADEVMRMRPDGRWHCQINGLRCDPRACRCTARH